MITKEVFMHYIIKIAHTVQHSWAGTLLVSGMAYFAPISTVIYALLSFVLADIVFGVWASRKAKKPIKSKRLRKSAVKTVCYVSLVLLLYVAEHIFLDDWVATHKIGAGILCLVELLSIGESMVIITDGHPGVKSVLKFIRGKSGEKYGSLQEDISREKEE